MRNFLFLVIAILLCGILYFCKKVPADEVPQVENDTLPAIEEEKEEWVAPDTPSIATLRDTLRGIFDGKHYDLLIAEPVKDSYEPVQRMDDNDFDTYGGWFYSWRVYTKYGTVKDKIIENTVGITFVREGDLDGDGKDEWGYITLWPTSTWMKYHLYKNYNGEWGYMIEPTIIWLPHLDEVGNNKETKTITAEDIIRKSQKKGYLKVKFSDIRNHGEDFLIIDTLIRINSHPKEYE